MFILANTSACISGRIPNEIKVQISVASLKLTFPQVTEQEDQAPVSHFPTGHFSWLQGRRDFGVGRIRPHLDLS